MKGIHRTDSAKSSVRFRGDRWGRRSVQVTKGGARPKSVEDEMKGLWHDKIPTTNCREPFERVGEKGRGRDGFLLPGHTS